MHTQMLSFEDSTIRDAVFPAEVGERREEMNRQNAAVVAWVGIDWADEGHEVCEYDVAARSKRSYAIEHSPESLQEWANCGYDTAGNQWRSCWSRHGED